MVKYASYKQQIEKIREYYLKQHQNWVSFKAKISKWKLWKNVLEVAESSVKKIQNYLDRIARGDGVFYTVCSHAENVKKRQAIANLLLSAQQRGKIGNEI